MSRARIAAPRWVAFAAILTAAALVRTWHLAHGLPDFLEEAIPLKKAFDMWGWAGDGFELNPHFFNYPSLVIYLHLLLQKLSCAAGTLTGTYASPADYWLAWQIDPTGPVVLGRLLGVAADLATVVAVWRLGERRRPGVGLLAAAVVALAAPLVLTSRLIYVEPVMTALMACALERLDAHLTDGRRSSLITAVVLIGLAAGAKYNAGLLVLPLAWVLWATGGWRGLLRWPLWVLLSVAVFLATSPYVVLDFAVFWDHFSYERAHMAAGHLGTGDRLGAGFVVRSLVGALGWPLIGLALVGLGRAIGTVHRRDASGLVVVWATLVPLLLSVLLFKMTAIRYLAPVVPLLALAAAAAAFTVRDLLGTSGRGLALVTAGLCLLTVGPAAWRGLHAGRSGAEHTQIQAREWLEANLRPDDIVLQEDYGPRLRDPRTLAELRRHPTFAAAGADRRAEVDAWRSARAVTIPLIVSGQLDIAVAAGDDPPRRLVIFENARDANQIFYDPRLAAGVDYVVTSGAVSERYRRDPGRFAAQAAFYTWLAAAGDTVAVFGPDALTIGPRVVVQKLRRTPDAAVPLPPDWWLAALPPEFLRDIVRLEQETGLSAATAAVVPVNSGLPSWTYYLRPVFNRYLPAFLGDLATHLIETNQARLAVGPAQAVNIMLPADAAAARLCARGLALSGRSAEALQVLDACLALTSTESPDAAALHLERARVLRLVGRMDEAIAELNLILATVPPESPRWRSIRELAQSWASGVSR